MPRADCAVHVPRQVSIRARHCWRAMRATPRPAARKRGSFNPRPPLLAGDASAAAVVGRLRPVSIRARHCWRAMLCDILRLYVRQLVSIRARHCWRAMRQWPSCNLRCTPCFNPRPPLLAGDAKGIESAIDAGYVSIRARHCWRAMRWRPVRSDATAAVSIRARHCWRAMLGSALLAGWRGWFQSAPAIAGGRCPTT